MEWRRVIKLPFYSISASAALRYAQLGVAISVGLVWFFSVRELDLKIAWFGWSPIDWVNQLTLPGNFRDNFSTGIEAYRFSAFMQVYPLAWKFLGVPPVQLIYAVIGLEIALLAFAMWRLSVALLPEGTSPAVPLLAVMLLISSHAGTLDLGRFDTADFGGLYYNAADALRLLAIASVVQRRYLTAGLLLAVSCATHPILGLIGVAFVIAMHLRAPGELFQPRPLAAGAIFLLVFGAWAAQLSGVGFATGGIPDTEWVALTRTFSFHWYPVEYGLFTTEHQERFVPYLAFLILLVFYLSRAPFRREPDRRVALGLLAMAALTVAGILISALWPAPVLVKLSLQRASLLLFLVGLPYVVAGLWSEIRSQSSFRRAVALGLLISPFLAKPGFPLGLALVLTFPAWHEMIIGRGLEMRNLGIVSLATASLALLGAYVLAGMAGPWNSPAYTGGVDILWFVAAFWAVFTVLSRVPSARRVLPALAAVAAFLIVCGWAFHWLEHLRMSSEDAAVKSDYKAAQLWARANTETSALFMVDPTIYYGWRDYSQRSSFGNLREWLFTTWLYDSSLARYQEGMRRFREFGIELQPFLRYQPPLNGYAALGSEVRKKFYAADDAWRKTLAARYGIDYFVFMRQFATPATTLPVVYENKHFMIVTAPAP